MLPNGSFRVFASVFLECSVSGGQAPYAWNWSISDGTNVTIRNVYTPYVTLNHTFEATGTYSVRCVVTDAAGANGSAEFSIRVTNWPAASVKLLVWPFGSVLQGYTVQMEAQTQYGYGPFNFTWSGLPPGCTADAPDDYGRILCSPTAPGTYNVSVTVTDSVTGATAHAFTTLTVVSAFLGMPQQQGLEVTALVVLLVLVSEALARLIAPVRPQRGTAHFRRGWLLSLFGGVIGVLSLALPWLYVTEFATPTTTVTALFSPSQVLLGNPSSSLPPQMLGNFPFYPSSLWNILGTAIVGYLIFCAGCFAAIARRMQGGFLMLLGLIVAYAAVPPDAFGSRGPGAGWVVGLVAALVAVVGYFTWYPPSGLAGPLPAVVSKEEEGESSLAEPGARDRE